MRFIVGQTEGVDFAIVSCNISYTMPKRVKVPTMSDLLRKALRGAESLNAIERATGLKRQTLAKFMRGEQSLRLDLADKLAAYFGIESRVTRGRSDFHEKKS